MFRAALSSAATSPTEYRLESASILFITLSKVGIFEPGRKESLLFPPAVPTSRDDVPDDRERELSEPCFRSFAKSPTISFPFAPLVFVACFNFRDDDPDDEVDDDFVLVDAPLEERDEVDDEFVLVDAPLDERDDLDDELPAPFDLVIAVVASDFCSVFGLWAPASTLPSIAAAAAFAAANKGLAGRSLRSSNNESAPRDASSLSCLSFG